MTPFRRLPRVPKSGSVTLTYFDAKTPFRYPVRSVPSGTLVHPNSSPSRCRSARLHPFQETVGPRERRRPCSPPRRGTLAPTTYTRVDPKRSTDRSGVSTMCPRVSRRGCTPCKGGGDASSGPNLLCSPKDVTSKVVRLTPLVHSTSLSAFPDGQWSRETFPLSSPFTPSRLSILWGDRPIRLVPRTTIRTSDRSCGVRWSRVDLESKERTFYSRFREMESPTDGLAHSTGALSGDASPTVPLPSRIAVSGGDRTPRDVGLDTPVVDRESKGSTGTSRSGR